MRVVLQRVREARVEVEGKKVAEIGKGYLLFLGVGHQDEREHAEKLWKKISKLRIFEDEQGKTNLSLESVQGSLLVVSQFTLFADCKGGHRPSFTGAAPVQKARDLYQYFLSLAKQDVSTVEEGVFGADMKVHLLNDGPFTLCLDTDFL